MLASAHPNTGIGFGTLVARLRYIDNGIASVEEDLDQGELLQFDIANEATLSTTFVDGMAGSSWNHATKLRTDEGVPNIVEQADFGLFCVVKDLTPVVVTAGARTVQPFSYLDEIRVTIWGPNTPVQVLGSTDGTVVVGTGMPVYNQLSGLAGNPTPELERTSLDPSPAALSASNMPRGIAIAEEAVTASDALFKMHFNGWRGFHLY